MGRDCRESLFKNASIDGSVCEIDLRLQRFGDFDPVCAILYLRSVTAGPSKRKKLFNRQNLPFGIYSVREQLKTVLSGIGARTVNQSIIYNRKGYLIEYPVGRQINKFSEFTEQLSRNSTLAA